MGFCLMPNDLLRSRPLRQRVPFKAPTISNRRSQPVLTFAAVLMDVGRQKAPQTAVQMCVLDRVLLAANMTPVWLMRFGSLSSSRGH